MSGVGGKPGLKLISCLVFLPKRVILEKCLAKTLSRGSLYFGISSHSPGESQNVSKFKQFVSLEAPVHLTASN